MIYTENITVIGNSYPGNVLDENFKISCTDVNLLVGNQGCGKSTLLQMLSSNHKDLKLDLTAEVLKKGVESFFFDTEKDNPRVKELHHYTTPSGESRGMGIGAALASHFQSHGEVLAPMVINPLLEAKNCVILLDEPEAGLSLTNQFLLISAIQTAVENNCQIFIATHCYPLIQNFDVISLEHKKQMSGVDFINLIKT